MDGGDHRLLLDAVLVDVVLDPRRREVHDLLPRALVPRQLERRAGHLGNPLEHVGRVGPRRRAAGRVPFEGERAALALEVVVLALGVDVAAVGLAALDRVAVGVEKGLDPAVEDGDDDERREHAGDARDDCRDPAGLGVRPVLGRRDEHLLGALGEDEVDVDEEGQRDGKGEHEERLDQRVLAAEHERAKQQEEHRGDEARDDRRREPRDDDRDDAGKGRDLAWRRGSPVDGLGASPDEGKAHDAGDDRVRGGDVEAWRRSGEREEEKKVS